MADDYDAIVIGAGIGRHYCYLADSQPDIERLAGERLLDGYTIDLGYHGVPCGGKGYLGKLTGYLGVEVKINPCDTGLYDNGEFYVEPSPGDTRLDDRIYRISRRRG